MVFKSKSDNLLKETSRVLSLISTRWELHLWVALEAASYYYFGENISGKEASWINLFKFALLGACSWISWCALNDIYDVEIDKINYPDRPLTSGKVSLLEAWTVVILTGSIFFFTSLGFANGVASYFFLLVHCWVSVTYSIDTVDFKSHWLMGPLCIGIGSFTGKALVISWTSLYQSEYLYSLAWIIPVVVCTHELLIIPLKDISDMEGDLACGRQPLVSKIPIYVVKLIASVGYTVPWILLVYLLSGFEGDSSLNEKIFKLQMFATLACLLGIYFIYLIFVRTDLFKWNKFKWIIELTVEYIFLYSLPFCC